jgi:hypothetical protein
VAVNPQLPQLYFRDLVGETYLVAAKTADKIRYLEEAQSLFAWSLRCLLIWLVMLAAVSLFVASTAPGPKPTEVRVLPAEGRAGPALVSIKQQEPLEISATLKPAGPVATGGQGQTAGKRERRL